MFETNSGAMGLRYLQNPSMMLGEEIVRKGKKIWSIGIYAAKK